MLLFAIVDKVRLFFKLIYYIDYKVVSKMLGSKGSVRDIKSFVSKVDNQEYVMICGCDRHIRVFNPQAAS